MRPARARTASLSLSRSNTLKAFGHTAIPAPTSSSSGACSKTAGSKPSRPSASAAQSPPMPPPTITIRMPHILAQTPEGVGDETKSGARPYVYAKGFPAGTCAPLDTKLP
jgi:hypothetical protein